MISPKAFGFIAITPAGRPNAALAIAGSRAGALGVLNLEFVDDPAQALYALGELSAHARGAFGALLCGDDTALLDLILKDRPQGMDAIVVAGGTTEPIAAIHAAGLRAIVVVTSLQQALAAQAAGADAVIAKGQEAGGWVGEETAFILLQHLVKQVSIPVWLQGGVGLHAAVACFVAGAAGVVLDSQLLLTRESPLPEKVRSRIESMDGSETSVFGASINAAFRAYSRPDVAAVDELRRFEASAELVSMPAPEQRAVWSKALHDKAGWQSDASLLAIGQDASFASSLARRFGTVGGVLAAMRTAIQEHHEAAAHSSMLGEGSPLAQSHGTRYPIVQGPMTRVSDKAAFADAVAEAGALPFLALALMRGEEIRRLLQETRDLIGDKPWGVGILGFVPPELRAEQLAVVREARPPFALIAGGRPDHAKVLEADGITTYLHVPSPGLLRMFLQDGAQRFVFEGRECGGHIGPRSSFVLWESMIDVIIDHIDNKRGAGDFHVLFAGGVHDGMSAAMVAAMAAPLAQRGVRIGTLVGTAYVFTREAVETGAIQAGFQQAAIESAETVTLEAVAGYATRCLPSPFADVFTEEKRRLIRSGVSGEELKETLEELNIGRLRIASKGVDHNPDYGKQPDAPRLISVAPEEQWQQGMYMIGQVAALHDRVLSLAELHEDIARGSREALPAETPAVEDSHGAPPQAAVAIIGMGTILPGAPNLRTFWDNILNKVDAIREVPPERWDWREYFDEDRTTRDKVYSRWGGFLEDVPFDPLQWGMPPNSLTSIEPFQLLGLAVVHDALEDAGYLDRPFPRERTSVILGAGGGGADLMNGYMVRSSLPGLLGDAAPELVDSLGNALPEWTEDSFAGVLMNVAAGRIANRFDFGGVNYTIDAACASSLAAVFLGVRELEMGTSDVVVVGGVDGIQNPFGFLCFAKTQALSPSGHCRPFSAEADGIAISEGYAALVLKRLEDAERDGDNIYAVIRGAAGSSDGRDRGLTAPRPEGQIRALERAYAQAHFDPATVGLIEAHGTGTVAGDQAEIESLTRFFGDRSDVRETTAVGSVKSMIGHTKATAGVAGLVKITQALRHRVLPPTLGVDTPNPRANFPETPFYVNTETRPWIKAAGSGPRRAGVSAFGFGGTNFHVVVEEYTGSYLPDAGAVVEQWPAELLIWRSESADQIATETSLLLAKLEAGGKPRLADLAYTLMLKAEAAAGKITLAIVSESLDQLIGQLRDAQPVLENGGSVHNSQGINFSDAPLAAEGKVAYLFPGQGSQSVNMLKDVTIAFPEVRDAFDRADSYLAGRLVQPLSKYIFPPPAFTPETEKAQTAALTATSVTQPALGVAGLAFMALLESLGVEPAMAAGHSYGEFVALHAAGAIDDKTLMQISEARGRFIEEGVTDESGTMAAVSSGPEALQPLTEKGITLSNLNSPKQTVIAGTKAAVDAAVAWCAEQGLSARALVVACAFHSPLVAPAQKRLAELLHQTPFQPARVPVFSNTTASEYPTDPAAITALLSDHLVRPVQFVREIEAMYEAGARIFIEVGPRQVLTGLTGNILGDKPHIAVSLDNPRRNGLVQLLHASAALLSEGVALNTQRFFRGRNVQRLDISKIESETGLPQHSPTTWLVNGGGARPMNAPSEPRKALQVTIQPRGAVPAVVAIATSAAPANAATSAAYTNGAAPGAAASPAPLAAAAVSAQTNGLASSSVPQASAAMPAPAPAPTRPSVGEQSMNQPSENPQWQPAPVAGSQSEVMNHFQHVMQRFLDVQESVMLQMLGSPGLASAPAPAIAAPVHQPAPQPQYQPPAPPAYANGATNGLQPAFAPPSPAEAVAPVAAEPYVAPVDAPAAVAAAPAVQTMDRQAISDLLLDVVSERTGYPAQALNFDADLEADLGVDSIKRVEIAGELLRVLAPHFSTTPEVELITTKRTLRAVVDQLDLFLRPVAPLAAGNASSNGSSNGHGAMTAPAAAFDRQQITDQLLAVVSERTGYPAEALNLNADLEADLGIDSIKRVEIAGEMIRRLSDAFSAPPEVEALTTRRTLNELIAQLEAFLQPRAPDPGNGAAALALPKADAGAGAKIERFVLRSVPAPLANVASALDPSGSVLIVDDGTGVGDALAALLQARGLRVARVAPVEYRAAAANPEALERLCTGAGAVSALVFLPALRPYDPAARADDFSDVESLFLMLKALRPALLKAAGAGGAAVIAVTAMGGSFGVAHATTAYEPAHGGLAGVLKSVAQEWPSLRMRALDLERAGPHDMASLIERELFAADEFVEAGYRQGLRQTIKILAAPPVSSLSEPLLSTDAVVLVTGGARGITAEVSIALSRAYQPTLILVGRTAQPEGPEPPETASLDDPRETKRVLFQQLKAAGENATPAQIESRYANLMRAREVRGTLERLSAAGANASYRSCDVSDAAAFGALIDETYQQFGRIDGVIHGAGVIEDRLLPDKTLDSLRRVVSTKVNPAAVLAQKLRPESLRFLAFFSSVSGRLGNRGQSDYSAANEILNKLSQQLDARWPGQVVAINWGPWAGAGMVSAEAERQFAEHGVALISVERGCQLFMDELRAGKHGEPEVVFAGLGAEQAHLVLKEDLASTGRNGTSGSSTSNGAKPATSPLILPLLSDSVVRGPGRVEVGRVFSLDHDLYLRDHMLDGKAVVPFAVALEMMAETARAGWPDLQIAAIRDVQALKGIMLAGREEAVRVVAQEDAAAGERKTLDLSIVSDQNPNAVLYRGAIELAPRAATPVPGAAGDLSGLPKLDKPMPDVYRDWLFHGPSLQVITSVDAIGPAGASAWITPSSPAACLAGAPDGQWLLDPVVIDAAFQLQIIWGRHQLGITPLPSRLGRCTPLSFLGGGPIRCDFLVRPETQGPIIRSDIRFYDSDGSLLVALEDCQGTGSKALNRLSDVLHGREPVT